MPRVGYGQWGYVSNRAIRRHWRSRFGGSLDWAAVCGVAPGLSMDWLGTGNQREYETLASLEPCANCVLRGASAEPLRVGEA